jgi:3-oxoacyl-[acyl-carrier protein] reductase
MSGFSVLGGVSAPETIAEAIVFLVSDASRRTTGAVLDVTGGSILGARGSRAHSVRDLL